MTVPTWYFNAWPRRVALQARHWDRVSASPTRALAAGTDRSTPGEQVSFSLPLTNYVTTRSPRRPLTGVNATLCDVDAER